MDNDRFYAHVVSLGALVGTVAGWFPWLAAFVAFVWYVLQIYESHTVQKWLARRAVRKREKKHDPANAAS